MAWWDKPGLIARLSAELNAIADDDDALGDKERHERITELLADLLFVEREECALIEIAKQQGLPAEYRVDCNPLAVLQIEWVPAPPSAPDPDAGKAGWSLRVSGSR